MTSMRHRDGFSPVGRVVVAAGQRRRGTHPGGAGDVHVDVGGVVRVGHHRVGVRAAAGLHGRHLYRVGHVADVEDAHALEAGADGRVRAAVDPGPGLLDRHEQQVAVHRHVALPAGADDAGDDRRAGRVRNVEDVEPVEVAHERVVATEREVRGDEAEVAGIGRVEEARRLVDVRRAARMLLLAVWASSQPAPSPMRGSGSSADAEAGVIPTTRTAVASAPSTRRVVRFASTVICRAFRVRGATEGRRVTTGDGRRASPDGIGCRCEQRSSTRERNSRQTRNRASQWPRNASSSHHEPRAALTLASTTSGRPRGPASQSRTRRQVGGRAHGQPVAAVARGRSRPGPVSGNRTVSSGCPSGPKWCTSAPYAASL